MTDPRNVDARPAHDQGTAFTLLFVNFQSWRVLAHVRQATTWQQAVFGLGGAANAQPVPGHEHEPLVPVLALRGRWAVEFRCTDAPNPAWWDRPPVPGWRRWLVAWWSHPSHGVGTQAVRAWSAGSALRLAGTRGLHREGVGAVAPLAVFDGAAAAQIAADFGQIVDELHARQAREVA